MLNDGTVYLDHAGATPVRRDVLDRSLPLLTNFVGRALEHHSAGRRALLIAEEARRAVADCLQVGAEGIRFTPDGSQAGFAAVLGLALGRGRGGHVVTTTDEDEGVLAACRLLETLGFTVTYLTPDENGLISRETVEEVLTGDTVLASISLVNRFTGCRQPVEALAQLFSRRGVLFHCEASLGCLLELNVPKLGVDALSLSGCLIYGPRGAGLLWVREGVEVGGPVLECQDPSAIVGLAQALCLLRDEQDDWFAYLCGLRSSLLEKLRAAFPDMTLETTFPAGHPGIVQVSFQGICARQLVYQLDRWGVCVSETPYGVRFSPGRSTTSADLERAVEALVQSVQCIRTLQSDVAA